MSVQLLAHFIKSRSKPHSFNCSYHSETDQADNPVIVLDSPLPSRHNLHPSEKDDEPDFDVISEEEVVAARNEPCPFDSPLKVGHVAESRWAGPNFIELLSMKMCLA